MLDKFVRNTVREVSIDYIQKVICDYFDIPIEIMKSKTRKREIVQCRQLAMYFAKQLTKNSLAMIGKHCETRTMLLFFTRAKLLIISQTLTKDLKVTFLT